MSSDKIITCLCENIEKKIKKLIKQNQKYSNIDIKKNKYKQLGLKQKNKIINLNTTINVNILIC